jgi:hypothetical protein
MVKKIDYSIWIGTLKTAKNSAILLIPFLLAVLAGFPEQYAWIAGPIAYFIKNLYENKVA